MSLDVRAQKLQALYAVASSIPPIPPLMFLLGLLAGAIDRVYFVRSLEGAPIAVRLSASSARIWPSPGFDVTVKGIKLSDPVALGSIVAATDDPICVQLVFGPFEGGEHFQKLVLDSYEDILGDHVDEKAAREQRIEELKKQVDYALDIYNECLRQEKAETDEKRRRDLRQFLAIARTELEECSSEMRRLEERLDG